MSDQAITAFVQTAQNGKIFTVTATDYQWENVLTDSIGSNDLGQVMAGSTVNNVALLYTAGNCIARIQDRNTLKVKRTITGSKAGTTDFGETAIIPYVIQPNDILVCYPQPMELTANQSNCLAWLTLGANKIAFGQVDIADGVVTELTSLVNSQSLGTYYNQALSGIEIMLEDGASLSSISIVDPNGGNVITIPATTRDVGHYYFNLRAFGLSIPVLKGMVFNVTSTTS